VQFVLRQFPADRAGRYIPHQAPGRPIQFDQKIEEWLIDRFGRGHLDHRISTRAFFNGKTQSSRTLAKSTPACLNTSCGANGRTFRPTHPWLRRYRVRRAKAAQTGGTVSLPRPAASANNGVSDMQEATAKAAARF
jgi:hypothetical protein